MAKEQASQVFGKAIERVQLELANQILDLKEQGLTKQEILLVLESLDMEDIVLNQLGLNADIDRLMLEYESVLASMEMTGEITDEVLTSLVRMDKTTLIKNAGMSAEKVKSVVAQGILGNASERDIMQSILKGSGGVLRADQADTLANTALNQFERNVTMEMAENDPPDAKYVYIGALDDKTRPICLEMISAGALTRKEIDLRFSGAFETAGGFNCRHRWSKETSQSSKLTNPKGAKNQISKIKNYKKPLTPREQLNV